MSERPTVLVAEDDEAFRELVRDVLELEGFRVTLTPNGQAALSLAQSQKFDFLLTDLYMPEMGGLELLQAIQKLPNPPTTIVMTAHGTIDTAVEATKLGAYGFVTKPISRDRLIHTIRKVLEEQRLLEENRLLRLELEKRYRYGDIIGKSPRMQEVFHLLRSIAETETTILICGANGTGKEMVARAIHAQSERRDRPIVAVNCAGITETLLESELFGHRRGAFTGAIADKKGVFQVAHGGTLFLDEIGDMSPAMQAKLLRALQQGEIHPVGNERTLKVDVRIIAATNRDLARAIREGTFRDDLYYRLNVITITLPALKDRREDIPLLVDHFLAKHNAKLKKRVEKLTPEAMGHLLDHSWPGNVRELENCIERAVVLSRGDTIGVEQLPPALRKEPTLGEEREPDLDAIIRQAILRALLQVGGNRRKAASLLGMSERTLYRKIKGYGLDSLS